MANSYGPHSIVQDGLVFTMDAGNTLSFTSGSTTSYNLMGGQTGSLINATQYNSDGGGCFEFDGTDDRIDCDTFDNIVGTSTANGYSIELWVKADTGLSNYDLMIGNATTTYATGGWSILFKSDTKIMADGFWGDSGSDRSYPSYATNAATLKAAWHMINVVYTGATVYCYMNAIKGTVYSDPSITGAMDSGDEAMQIGGTTQSATTEWEGWITAVKVYNRSLSDAEIQQNYEATKGRFS